MRAPIFAMMCPLPNVGLDHAVAPRLRIALGVRTWDWHPRL